MSFGARALIRLAALHHNLNAIKEKAAGAPVMAVVKANAYGHGLTVVANELAQADSLAVARIVEAHKLRDAGIKQPIVLLSGVVDDDELRQAGEAMCELVVHNEQQIILLEQNPHLSAVAWLKVDTGLNRLGFGVDAAVAALARLRNCKAVRELRLMTHLANADDPADNKTVDQLAVFAKFAGAFEGDISIANSAGLFGWEQAVRPSFANARTWVRPGVAIYGISPFPVSNGADLGLKPVMQFESRLLAVKPLAEGEHVGYGGTWQSDRQTTLGIVSAGYGDGYSRYIPSGTNVLLNERLVPTIGNVSMDMTAVDLGSDSRDNVGDSVILWGDALPVEEVARQAATIPYQLVCGVMNRESSTVVPN